MILAGGLTSTSSWIFFYLPELFLVHRSILPFKESTDHGLRVNFDRNLGREKAHKIIVMKEGSDGPIQLKSEGWESIVFHRYLRKYWPFQNGSPITICRIWLSRKNVGFPNSPLLIWVFFSWKTNESEPLKGIHVVHDSWNRKSL